MKHQDMVQLPPWLHSGLTLTTDDLGLLFSETSNLSLCVCMSVHVHVCMCVCEHVHVCVLCVCTYVCLCVCAWICVQYIEITLWQ